MNNDLFSREALIEMGVTCFARRNENGKLEAIISIDEAPTVELLMARGTNGVVIPITRPTGEWVTDNLNNIICNKCGGIRRDNRIEYISFCNRCGAYMRNYKA